MQTQLSYKDFLLREFRLRKRRNIAYSMKAFARDLGLQGSKLSEILAGKKGLSVDRARRVAGALRLSSRETDLFVTMVMAAHSRSLADREKSRAKLQKQTVLRGAVIDAERFQAIADWHHFAILEILGMKGSGRDVKSLAERLGLTQDRIKESLTRLEAMGLVENDENSWRNREAVIETSDDISSTAIREHHHQMLEKGQSALNLDVELREFQSLMTGFDLSDVPEAKQYLRNVITEFTNRFGARNSGQNLYALCVQFFPLDKNKKVTRGKSL
jgi:uncharacterized protein (TIGR02147 family)